MEVVELNWTWMRLDMDLTRQMAMRIYFAPQNWMDADGNGRNV